MKAVLPRPRSKATLKKLDTLDEPSRLFHIADEISVGDIVKELNVSKATATRLVSRWLAEGKVIRIGKGSATRYTLKR